MSHFPSHSFFSWQVLLGLSFCLLGCKSKEKIEPVPANPALAGAWVDSAKSAPADHALALLVSALKVDPKSTEAREATMRLLNESRWSIPTQSITHPFRISHIAYASPAAAWVSIEGPQNTTVLWNLETLQIQSVLFPVPACETRCLVFDPAHRSVVIQRGDVTLLCNALTLKPIRDLGRLPESLIPASVIAFSPDGLLMAHPATASAIDSSIVWHLRDVASGEILRSSKSFPSSTVQPLSAALDRSGLRVIHENGSLMVMPISPIEEIRTVAATRPCKLTHAQFLDDRTQVIALQEQGPHQAPALTLHPPSDQLDLSQNYAALARRFPWSRQPTIWKGILQDSGLTVTGRTLQKTGIAPIHTDSPISAVAFQTDSLITGEENGLLTVHRFLPPPKVLAAGSTALFSPNTLLALEKLSAALAGTTYESRNFHHLSAEERHAAMKDCDLSAVRSGFPELDFTAIKAAFLSDSPRIARAEASSPLTQRLAASRLCPTPPTLLEIFRSQDPIAINAAIGATGGTGGTGHAAAHTLALSLASDHPEWIDACLATATQLPPLLRKIAHSRLALLQGQQAKALADWTEPFPELSTVRLREDWHGWEQADFQPALDQIRKRVTEELSALKIPEKSSPQQRATVIAHLSDPETVKRVGQTRFVEACLQAALVLVDLKEDTATAFQLANYARTQGAAPEPCLRVEAMALTNLGDFKNAHTRWIELITEHPVEAQLPSDYAEAAYTAFENSKPAQAMEILTTGIHRFPLDANYALRAGWVALLTRNPEKAYRFLREGQRIGFPEAKLENATALLAIAAAQSGAQDDATVYFKDLLAIDPAWNDPRILDSLSWPEEVKSTLRDLMR
jgi:tetratricopeptide (TPR) repeat protein